MALLFLISTQEVGAKAGSWFTAGAGVHVTYRGAMVDQKRKDLPMSGGLHLRAKLLRIIGIQVDFEWPGGGDDPLAIANLDNVVLAPNLNVIGTIEVFPNRYFSPMLLGGYGWDITHKSRPGMIIAGLAAEVQLTKHWTLGGECRLIIPAPSTASDMVAAIRAAATDGQKSAQISANDPDQFFNLRNYQFILTLRYYL
jgi:hypothetical protein